MIKENEMIIMTEKEYTDIIKSKDSKIEQLEIANEMLRKALLKKIGESNTYDVQVSRQDFLKIYNEALDYMFDNPNKEINDIYGYPITVHWHGIYCDCSDGATSNNYIIPGIKACDEELDGEECIIEQVKDKEN